MTLEKKQRVREDAVAVAFQLIDMWDFDPRDIPTKETRKAQLALTLGNCLRVANRLDALAACSDLDRDELRACIHTLANETYGHLARIHDDVYDAVARGKAGVTAVAKRFLDKPLGDKQKDWLFGWLRTKGIEVTREQFDSIIEKGEDA